MDSAEYNIKIRVIYGSDFVYMDYFHNFDTYMKISN